MPRSSGVVQDTLMPAMSPNIPRFERVCRRIEKDPRILAAYVVGSAVTDTMRPDSDIDIAILPDVGSDLSPLDVFDLSADLSVITTRTVDLGQLSGRNLVYASEALLKGCRFHCVDIEKADLMASTLLGLAMAFNMERREILDAYRA